eukprot:ANDGO_00034.mRNA.1 hypothetical protein
MGLNPSKMVQRKLSGMYSSRSNMTGGAKQSDLSKKRAKSYYEQRKIDKEEKQKGRVAPLPMDLLESYLEAVKQHDECKNSGKSYLVSKNKPRSLSSRSVKTKNQDNIETVEMARISKSAGWKSAHDLHLDLHIGVEDHTSIVKEMDCFVSTLPSLVVDEVDCISELPNPNCDADDSECGDLEVLPSYRTDSSASTLATPSSFERQQQDTSECTACVEKNESSSDGELGESESGLLSTHDGSLNSEPIIASTAPAANNVISLI